MDGWQGVVTEFGTIITALVVRCVPSPKTRFSVPARTPLARFEGFDSNVTEALDIAGIVPEAGCADSQFAPSVVWGCRVNVAALLPRLLIVTVAVPLPASNAVPGTIVSAPAAEGSIESKRTGTVCVEFPPAVGVTSTIPKYWPGASFSAPAPMLIAAAPLAPIPEVPVVGIALSQDPLSASDDAVQGIVIDPPFNTVRS